jgi:GNAT superfamily N-acetyltransferase
MKAGRIRLRQLLPRFTWKVENRRDVSMSYTITPLTPDRWEDLEKLFGPRGAVAGCWCMYWRIPHSQFEQQSGIGNRLALKAVVESGNPPGLLAYDEQEPIGWCTLAPRSDFTRLEHSRVLAPVDEAPVWSIPCFFIHRKYRRKGVSVLLLRAAIEYGKDQGAKILEGYPIEPIKDRAPDAFVYTGLLAAFQQVGFVEVARRSPNHPIVRYYID